MSNEVQGVLNSLEPEKADSLTEELSHLKQSDSSQYNSLCFLISAAARRSVVQEDSDNGFNAEIHALSAGQLIQHVRLAHRYGWPLVSTGVVSVNAFREYVLPYRLSTEPLNNWREACLNGSFARENIKDTASLIRVVSKINSIVRQNFVFDYRAAFARDQNWKQLYRSKRGDCFSMVALAAFPLRAVGVPVTYDLINSWGNVNGGQHVWNVVVRDDQKFYPFMGCESDPGRNYLPFTLYKSLVKRSAKIFRNQFSENDPVLSALQKDGLLHYVKMESPYFKDVTSLYTPTSDICLSPTIKGNKWTFINVFSNGRWTPVFAECNKQPTVKGKNRKIRFHSMAREMLYIVSAPDLQVSPYVTNPFFLDSVGELKVFTIDRKVRINIVLTEVCSKLAAMMASFQRGLKGNALDDYQSDIYNGVKRNVPKDRRLYSLYFWDKEWIPGARAVANDGKLLFRNLPSGTLYKLSGNENKTDRPFAVIGHQVIWF